VPYSLQLPIHAAAADQAGLGAAIEHLLDGVKSGVINTIAERHVKHASRRDKLHRQNAEPFEQTIGQHVPAGKIVHSPRDQNRTSPLQSERRRYLLFGGKAQFFQPFPEATMTAGTLDYERGL
jgi:hypothetical protein